MFNSIIPVFFSVFDCAVNKLANRTLISSLHITPRKRIVKANTIDTQLTSAYIITKCTQTMFSCLKYREDSIWRSRRLLNWKAFIGDGALVRDGNLISFLYILHMWRPPNNKLSNMVQTIVMYLCKLWTLRLYKINCSQVKTKHNLTPWALILEDVPRAGAGGGEGISVWKGRGC